MNLSELTLVFLEDHCEIVMPRLGDASLRRKLKALDSNISDIYPPSGSGLRAWEIIDLNPDWLGFSGEYNEVQLKENIILPILTLARQGVRPFVMGKCPEYPIDYKDKKIQLEGIADMVYGKAPSSYTRYIDFPLLCVHEYKRGANPVTVSQAMAQLLGALWIITQKNLERGCESEVYGVMIKGQNWHFTELHRSESKGVVQYHASFDFSGFGIESDLEVILKSLRHYFFQIQQILEREMDPYA